MLSMLTRNGRRLRKLLFIKRHAEVRHFTSFTPSDQTPKKYSVDSPSTQNIRQVSAFKAAVDTGLDMIWNPRKTWNMIKEGIHHYWVGSKLLWSEIKIASQILNRLLMGHVPFMELLLPFALKLFPNMLPSTFQDALSKEESMKKELQMRLEVAKFMQETLQQMVTAKEKKTSKDLSNTEGGQEGAGAKELIEFVGKVRLGEAIPNDYVIRMARLFEDELTLSNIARPQLVSMCRFMGLQAYGADSFMRFQLRTKLRFIKEDDRRILWEGIDSLSVLELREACRERGMPSMGLTQFKYRSQLQQWLDLSMHKNVPISLLIMSRAFTLVSTELTEGPTTISKSSSLSGGVSGLDDRISSSQSPVRSSPEQHLRRSISSLDLDMINEVVLAQVSASEENTMDIKKRKLESLEFQRELMEEERQELRGALEKKAALKNAVAVSVKSAAILNDVYGSSIQRAITAIRVHVSRWPRSEGRHSKDGITGSTTSASIPFIPTPNLDQDGVDKHSATQQKQAIENKSPLANNEIENFAATLTSVAAAAEKAAIITNQNDNFSSTASPASHSHQSGTVKELHDSRETIQSTLSLSEMQTLLDLARGSAVQREKAELAILQANALFSDTYDPVIPENGRHTTSSKRIINNKDSDESRTDSSAEDGVHSAASLSSSLEQPDIMQDNEILMKNRPSTVSAHDDKSMKRMNSMMQSMLKKLNEKIEITEKALGDRLYLLDKDGDGEISAEELQDAMVKILKRFSSVKDAQELVNVLDSNKDGKVSMAELEQYLVRRRERLEVEELEAQLVESRPFLKSGSASSGMTISSNSYRKVPDEAKAVSSPSQGKTTSNE